MPDTPFPGAADAPPLDHHPRSLVERLDDLIECGLTALIGVGAAALYITIAELTPGPESMDLLPALCHTILESPFLTCLSDTLQSNGAHSMMHKPRILHILATGCGLAAGVLAADPWQASTTVTLAGSGLCLLIAAGLFFRA